MQIFALRMFTAPQTFDYTPPQIQIPRNNPVTSLFKIIHKDTSLNSQLSCHGGAELFDLNKEGPSQEQGNIQWRI